jgi:hypothetical protein
MAHLAPHQDPWFHDVFYGTVSTSLSDRIAAVAQPRVGWLRRCVALVMADNGYWREERLIEGLDGTLTLEIDSHRGEAPYREPLPAEISRDYDALVAMLKTASRKWPSTDGLHREPGSGRVETIVMLDAALLEGRALMGESAVKAFRKIVFPSIDVGALKRR